MKRTFATASSSAPATAAASPSGGNAASSVSPKIVIDKGKYGGVITEGWSYG